MGKQYQIEKTTTPDGCDCAKCRSWTVEGVVGEFSTAGDASRVANAMARAWLAGYASRPKPFNELSPAEVERLALPVEEMGEVLRMIGKVMRHGYSSSNPLLNDDNNDRLTNREELQKEVGDLLFALRLMGESRDIDLGKVDAYAESKGNRIWKWMHHNTKPATKSGVTCPLCGSPAVAEQSSPTDASGEALCCTKPGCRLYRSNRGQC